MMSLLFDRRFLVFLFTISILTASQASPQTPSSLDSSLQEAVRGELALTTGPDGQFSFIRGELALAALGWQPPARPWSPHAAATAFLDRYGALFGVRDAATELAEKASFLDELGMQHLLLRQTHRGLPVFGASLHVHFSADGRSIVAVNSGFIPDLEVERAQIFLNAEQAVTRARQALPGGVLGEQPTLWVWPERHGLKGFRGRLAWLVELRDDALPARNLYAVDSASGELFATLDRLYEGRDRITYSAENTFTLPGTLIREEDSPAIGDADVDHAHLFAGETYDYFFHIHGRDSYDDLGAPLISTVHFRKDYPNAFWNGRQMVYGDGFAVRDVVAHELTHAVTEHMVNLQYRWQAGALNESFSDIFGAMVDRDDWLLGEDLPIGAVRSLADPSAFGQGAHTEDWLATCEDNEGVHTNSGITNHAFFLIAESLGKEKTESIFFRMLSAGYLHSTASLEDARAAALQSATDLYGSESAEHVAIDEGFRAVGLDGSWSPPQNDCGCAAAAVLDDPPSFARAESLVGLAATLYRLRDQLLDADGRAAHYRRLYDRHTGRISFLLLRDGKLRRQAAGLLSRLKPGLSELLDDRPDRLSRRVSPSLTRQLKRFLRALQEADREAIGGGQLALTLEMEIRRLDWQRLPGSTFRQAWESMVGALPPVR